MWSFKFSSDMKDYGDKYNTKEEALFYCAIIIKPYLIRNDNQEYLNEEEFLNSIPDIYIYEDGELNEIIRGRNLV